MISIQEYERKRKHGYAGPKSELLPETQAYWQATHWMLTFEAGVGTCLVPVDIEGLSPHKGEASEKRQDRAGLSH